MQLNVGTSDKKQYRLITLDNGLECLLMLVSLLLA